jgi:hypothetical protein
MEVEDKTLKGEGTNKNQLKVVYGLKGLDKGIVNFLRCISL